MSSNAISIEFRNIWKKYSKSRIFHQSLREDISNLFCLKKQENALFKDEFWALKDINFTVGKGETVGLWGPNGAGKSTILKLIANITYPSRGDLTVNGRVAPLIEIGAGFHPDLSGRENIFVNGAILGMTIPEIKNKMDAIIHFSEIGDFINMPTKKYSSGMYLRLAFSIAIQSEADINLIDEVISVGDEEFQKKCINKVYELKAKGKSFCIASHNKNLLEQLSDKIIHFENGKTINIENTR